MVRKQIYITADQQQQLVRRAAEERRPEAEVIRFALDRHLGKRARPEPARRRDPLWAIVGLGATTTRDGSEQVDHYLYGAPRR